MILNKKIIPILYGVDYHELPDWIKDYQGIEIDNHDVSKLSMTLKEISKKIAVDSVMTGIIIAGFIAAIILAGRES